MIAIDSRPNDSEDIDSIGEAKRVSSLKRCHFVRAIKIAVFVGIVLISINQGDQILNGEITTQLIIKMLMTPIVPFAVSLYSSWTALR